VTYSQLPDGSEGERRLNRLLMERGLEAEFTCWEDSGVQWSDYSHLVVRSTWNYHDRYNRFLSWIETVRKKQVIVWNPPETMLWNLEKTYLFDLRNRGVDIVPTRFIESLTRNRLREMYEDFEEESIVLKPIVGAGAQGIVQIHAPDEIESVPHLNKEREGWLVQPYLHEINKYGERSFIFYGQKFRHAVRKRPASNDFRVQTKYGGRIEPYSPPSNQRDWACEVMKSVDYPWKYARVDAVPRPNKLELMELEMTEPNLYFDKAGSLDRFADWLAESVQSKGI